jgi:hypothetical protein
MAQTEAAGAVPSCAAPLRRLCARERGQLRHSRHRLRLRRRPQQVGVVDRSHRVRGQLDVGNARYCHANAGPRRSAKGSGCGTWRVRFVCERQAVDDADVAAERRDASAARPCREYVEEHPSPLRDRVIVGQSVPNDQSHRDRLLHVSVSDGHLCPGRQGRSLRVAGRKRTVIGDGCTPSTRAKRNWAPMSNTDPVVAESSWRG